MKMIALNRVFLVALAVITSSYWMEVNSKPISQIYGVENKADGVDDAAESSVDLQPEIGPCKSAKDCKSNQTCDPNGMCLPCSYWDGSKDIPPDCIGVIIISKPVSSGEDGSNEDLKVFRCTQESDCDIGKWCLPGQWTCESCETLQSSPTEYKKECSRYINYQEQEKKKKLLRRTIAISVGTALLLIGLFTAAVCYFVWRRRRTRQHPFPVRENGGGGAPTELERLQENPNDAREEDSKEEAYGIAVADQTVGCSATT
ncbi:uncharacterized protein [Ptychodera flava]|uniref:uncharacterized protein n=1 Tax=Ptychodera flava TaxID=63121 RepID=UPI00396A9DC5